VNGRVLIALVRFVTTAAGVKLQKGQRFGFHNLRYSLATFLVNQGTDVKTVQGLLRHSNVTTTLGLTRTALTRR
jgi:site-specific recombinase XerD